MQEGAIKPGQKVIVVDDIIATGKLFHCLFCVRWVSHIMPLLYLDLYLYLV
jgi:hypoxanthine phosphoribosyltransferase